MEANVGSVDRQVRPTVESYYAVVASNFKMASQTIVDAMGGNSDLLGFYKYKNWHREWWIVLQPGWTTGEPTLYGDAQRFICAVDEVYRTFLPNEYRTPLRESGL